MSAAVAAAAAAALANRRNSTTASAASATTSTTNTKYNYNYNSYTNLHLPLSPPPRLRLSRYELQKREDWDAFGQYLKNHHHRNQPVSMGRCSGAHVVEFLRYLDQFGETKIHNHSCMFFGQAYAPAACPCPLKQAWSSLDALVGRLRAAFEENGGSPQTNPFGSPAVWLYLREVKESQAKARGIAYG